MSEANLIRAIGPENYGRLVLDACVIAAFTPSPGAALGGAPGECESSPGPTSTEEAE